VSPIRLITFGRSAFRTLHSYAKAVAVAFCLLTLSGCGGVASQQMNAEGVRLFQQSRYQEAILEFHKAVNNEPNNADSYYNLAATYHRIAMLTGDKESLRQAEHYYRMCLERSPDHMECHRGLAVLLVQKGQSKEAFELLAGWVQRQPALAEAKIEMARLYQEFGDPETAKQQLAEAIRNDPTNARALAAMGALREKAGETAAALKNYEEALARDLSQQDLAYHVSALRASLNQAAAAVQPTAVNSGGTQIATGAGAVRR
jgi:tetratricopeptide (TPR) repeat protein